MNTPILNPYEAVSAAPNTPVARNTPAEKTRAMLVTCDRIGAANPLLDPTRAAAIALVPLAALGFIDPYQPLPAIPNAGGSVVRHPGAATHGSRAGAAWHREQRTPLCGPCRTWLGTHDATVKEGA
jgi:hypothetical protein